MGGLPDMFQTALVRDEHVEPLAEGVLTVLENVGVLCQNEEMLRALAAAGARVDYASERARFPREMTAEFVESLHAEHEGTANVARRFTAPGLPGVGTQVAQLFHDYEKQEMRSSNKQDFITLTRLGDVLEPGGAVGHSLSLTDVPPPVEPLEAALLLAEHAHNPGAAFAWRVDQVDYLIEMGEILGRKNWFSYGAVCFAHPLRFDRDTAGKFVRRVREGVPTGMTAMPVAGVSTPATVEGFIVVSTAEHVAAWMAARAINPEVALSGSMWAGTVDMKTGWVSYSAPDAMFYAFASVEFIRKWCGKTIPVGGGEYCDAKAPGLYTALEKAHKSMTIAAFTGQPTGVGSGLFDEGKVLSPVQLLLDREMAQAVGILARGVDPTEENIGLSAILEVGIGLTTSHVETTHTLGHFRSSLWLPELMERAGWAGPDQERRVLDRTQAKVNELISRYTKPEGREDQLAAMRQVVERARATLLR